MGISAIVGGLAFGQPPRSELVRQFITDYGYYTGPIVLLTHDLPRAETPAESFAPGRGAL
jgi:hypothetical protein